MNWDRVAEDYLAVADFVFGQLREAIEEVAADFARRIQAGNKIMACGNGGSAADAQHFAGELVNRFLKTRRPYAGLALSTDTSILTCIGNDCGFDQVFEKQVLALGQAGDALLGISTSGNSANVGRAFEAARQKGVRTVLLTGGTGGKLASAADCVLNISCVSSTPRIQEGHQLVIHALCERMEEILL